MQKKPADTGVPGGQTENPTFPKLTELPELNPPRFVRQLSSICNARKRHRLLYNAAWEKTMFLTVTAGPAMPALPA
jgi:hypothetical protein